MKKLTLLVVVGLLALLAMALSGAVAHATTNCTFTTIGTTMVLNGNCTTDATILVPDGFTLDGNGFSVTAVGAFKGAVVANAGTTAHVHNLTIIGDTTTMCFSGDNRLRGIMFNRASGSIAHNTVLNIRRGTGNGCQEGNAIEVRNAPFDGTHPNTQTVSITHNTVDAYQKTGILANGDVEVAVTNNVVGSAKLPKIIAANSIQLGYGATGAVNNNTIVGNQWDKVTVPQWIGTAVLVYAAGDVNVNHNIISGEGTDVGIAAQYAGTVNVMNNTITRTVPSSDTLDAYGIGVSFYGNSGKSKVVRNTFRGWNEAFEGQDLAKANIVEP